MKLIKLLTLFFSFFLLTNLAYAQENPDTAAKKYGVTYPISDLGGCKDYSDCRQFCEDPVNRTNCISFAQKKGFYKEDKLQTEKDAVFTAAKKDLGCNSENSCREYCEQKENIDKCTAFAKKHDLRGGEVADPGKAQILEKARTVLGCDSHQSCSSFCSQETNRQRCSEFARQTGLRGGEEKIGPGGCNSEETCKTYCGDPNNFKECSKFGGANTDNQNRSGTFRGPGGCDSEQSCQSYCQKNPQDCRIISTTTEGPGVINDPQKAAEEYAKYCRENPKSCISGVQGPFGSREARENFEKFCRDNPQRCMFNSGEKNYDQIKMCNSTPNCSWQNNTCKCSSRDSERIDEQEKFCLNYPDRCQKPSNYPYPSVRLMDRQQQEIGCKNGGGTCEWNNNVCDCKGYKSPNPTVYNPTTSYYPTGTYIAPTSPYQDPATACHAAGGTWTNNYCQMSGANNNPGYQNPEDACRRTANCSWNGSSCQCTSQNNSQPTQPPQPPSNPTSPPAEQPTSAPNNTSGETQPSSSSVSPADMCSRAPGCSWNGSSCQCSQVQGISIGGSLIDLIKQLLRF